MTWIACNAILMIALPLALAVGLRRSTPSFWPLLGAGALSFAGSQLVHLPLLAAWQWLTRSEAVPGVGATAGAIVAGVLAAACEEPARWLVLRRLAVRDRTSAWAFGAGYGGLEALGLGVLALLGAIDVSALASMSVADLVALGVPEATAETTIEQVAHGLAMPWYDALGGAFERAITIPFHIACSVLVMASLRRARAWPFVAALVAHAIIDAAVGALGEGHPRTWVLEMELTALVVPFTVLVLAWAAHAEPADAARSS